MKSPRSVYSTALSPRRLLTAFGACISAFTLSPLQVQASLNVGDVQIGGFFSQGYLVSTHNNYPVDTKDGTADFREMAFYASTNIGSRLRIGGQLFAQTLGKYGDDKVTLDWATADYSFAPAFGIRAGRIKYPRSLHSDVLDVDVVRPFILLPQSIYDARLRDFQKSFDGAMIYGSVSAGKHSFDYKVFYGDIPMRTDSGVADFFNTSTLFANPPGLYTMGIDSVRGVALMWNTPINGLRIGVNYSKLENLAVVGPFQQLPALTSQIQLVPIEYENASVEYTMGLWTFTGEYLLSKGTTQLTLPAALRQPVTRNSYGTKSWYVSAARRIGRQFEAGAYYTQSKNSYPAVRNALDHLKDLTVALRYDYSEHLLFKIEAHSIHGKKDMFNVPDIRNPALKDSMMLFAAKTTISF